jgi:chemotaxis-related protein WspD
VLHDPGERVIRAPMDRCWRIVGVTGDQSCEHLGEVVHCRNCPVFVAAGRGLLQRGLPEGYAGDVASISESSAGAGRSERSYLVFRLWDEWFAFAAAHVREVATSQTIRRVAHRSGGRVLGLTNVRGQLLTCVSLRSLLGLEGDDRRTSRASRLVVAERSGETWGFPVDEVDGVRRFSERDFEPIPTTVPDDLARFHRGLVDTGTTRAAVIDPGAVFEALGWSLE